MLSVPVCARPKAVSTWRNSRFTCCANWEPHFLKLLEEPSQEFAFRSRGRLRRAGHKRPQERAERSQQQPARVVAGAKSGALGPSPLSAREKLWVMSRMCCIAAILGCVGTDRTWTFRCYPRTFHSARAGSVWQASASEKEKLQAGACGQFLQQVDSIGT